MPLNINIVQILLHVLNFVILAGALTLLTYKPVSEFLAKRRAKLAEAAAKNEKEAAEISALRKEYEEKLANLEKEAAEIRVKAEKEAALVATQTIQEANEEASRIISAAEKEAEERKVHILDSAQTEIGELVIEAAQKLLIGTASKERTAELYDAFLKTIQDKKQV